MSPTIHTHFLRIKGLSQKTTKSRKRDQVMLRVMQHNHREIVAEIGVRAGSKIDPTRIKDNVTLRGCDNAAGVDEAVKSIMAEVIVSKWRKDTISAIEIVFSLPANSSISHVSYFDDSVRWAEKFFNVPLVSAVIHLDEGAPHCHAILIPIIDGRLNGSKVMGNPKQVFNMQLDYHNNVSKTYGLAPHVPQKRYSAEIRREAIELAFKSLDANSGLLNNVIRALLEPHIKNPEPLLTEMCIEMPKPTTKAKTSTDIFIKKVKSDVPVRQHPKHIEVESQKHIEVQRIAEINPYALREVELSKPVLLPDSESIHDDYERQRDDHISSDYWDSDRGEFIKTPVKASSK